MKFSDWQKAEKERTKKMYEMYNIETCVPVVGQVAPDFLSAAKLGSIRQS